MKRLFLFLLVLGVAGGFAFSADLMDYPPSLEGGNILVDIGIGYAFLPTRLNSDPTMKIPPIVLSAEYCLPSGVPISVGALAGFYQCEWTGGTNWAETWTFVTFGARANWHWNIDVSWLDLYTGAFFGYTLYSYINDGNPQIGHIHPSYGGLSFGGQAGAHIYLSKHLGFVAEMGYPFVAKAGLALKF